MRQPSVYYEDKQGNQIPTTGQHGIISICHRRERNITALASKQGGQINHCHYPGCHTIITDRQQYCRKHDAIVREWEKENGEKKKFDREPEYEDNIEKGDTSGITGKED